MERFGIAAGGMLLVLLAGGCAGMGGEGGVSLAPSEAMTVIQGKPDVMVIDVRSRDEYDQGHIQGALLIPYVQFEPNLANNTVYPDINHARTPRKDQPVILYCQVGNRSRAAAIRMLGLGYTDVHHIADGVQGWQQAGLPLVKDK